MSIDSISTWLITWFPVDLVAVHLKAVLLFAVGIPLSYTAAKWIQRFLTARYSPQHGLITGQIVRYGGSFLFVTAGLNQLGFSLAPLLGAAGVIGVAIGFASQTSASNIISGLFIIVEEPFKIGDVITVGANTGAVLSIDLLSVKIRSFDNKFIRIPHETLLKSEVINLTRFPIRRVDVSVSVAYKENIAQVKELILSVVDGDNDVLKIPEPLIYFKEFGDSGIELVLFCWAAKDVWFSVKNRLPEKIKECFDEENIEIPFPHLKVYQQDAPFVMKSGGL